MAVIIGLIDSYRKTRGRENEIRFGSGLTYVPLQKGKRDVGVIKTLVKRRREETSQNGVVVDRGRKERKKKIVKSVYQFNRYCWRPHDNQ